MDGQQTDMRHLPVRCVVEPVGARACVPPPFGRLPLRTDVRLMRNISIISDSRLLLHERHSMARQLVVQGLR
jgi:hypothetical protein